MTFAEVAGVDRDELWAATATLLQVSGLLLGVLLAAALLSSERAWRFARRVWRGLRRRARKLPSHLPAPVRQRVRYEQYDQLPPLPDEKPKRAA